MKPSGGARLFNSALETGVRSALILDAARPRSFDLAHLTWLDHLVVHTADIGGPPSLHPDIPQRDGELLVRRRNVEAGLVLMRRLHMIVAHYSEAGISYSATDEAGLFAQLVRSPYGKALKERADWLVNYVAGDASGALIQLVTEKIGRWSIEFQTEGQTG